MMKPFKILLKILTSIINILNEEGFKLYDADNQDWYINNIRYNEDDDRLYFDLKEDKSNE